MNLDLLKDMIKIEVSNADEELRSFHSRCWCCSAVEYAHTKKEKKIAISMEILQIWFSFNLCFQFELFITINDALTQFFKSSNCSRVNIITATDWIHSFCTHLWQHYLAHGESSPIQLMCLNSKKNHLAEVLINPMKQQWCQHNNGKCDYSNQLNVVVTATYHHNWNLADTEASNVALLSTHANNWKIWCKQFTLIDETACDWFLGWTRALPPFFGTHRLRGMHAAQTHKDMSYYHHYTNIYNSANKICAHFGVCRQ